jgi:hypothetical protein
VLVYISDAGRGAPRLCAAADLGALAVRTETDAPDWEALSRTLGVAGAGEVIGGHVWLDIGWLRTAAGERDREWHDGFARMVQYAAAHGWLSADGGRVRAHVDWGSAGVH